MKKVLGSFVVICFVILISVLSCKKNKNSTFSTTKNQLFAGLRYTPQTLTVTAGRDTIVFGTSGTMLHFYATSFYGSGGIISSGTVNVQLVEMYKPGEEI